MYKKLFYTLIFTIVSLVSLQTTQAQSCAGNPLTQTFNATGGLQTFTVPAGVTEIIVYAQGADGGDNTGGNKGGAGAVIEDKFNVTPGETIAIVVGEAGKNGNAAGGGGGTFIARGNSFAAFEQSLIIGGSNLLISAAGGGGGDPNSNGGGGTGITNLLFFNVGTLVGGDGASVGFDGASAQGNGGEAIKDGAAGGSGGIGGDGDGGFGGGGEGGDNSGGGGSPSGSGGKTGTTVGASTGGASFSSTTTTNPLGFGSIINASINESGLGGAGTQSDGEVSICYIPPSAIANQTFSAATCALQTFTVPAGVTEITINAKGADGGNSTNGNNGGSGATIEDTYIVTPGETLAIIVGKAGDSGITGGGGGGTFINKGNSLSAFDSPGVFLIGGPDYVLMVAGGGGGADPTFEGGKGEAIPTGSTLIGIGFGIQEGGNGADPNIGGSNGSGGSGGDAINAGGVGGTGGTGGDGGFGGGGAGGSFAGGGGAGRTGGKGGQVDFSNVPQVRAMGGRSSSSTTTTDFGGGGWLGLTTTVKAAVNMAGVDGGGTGSDGSVTISYVDISLIAAAFASGGDVPTLSQWGLIILALMLMICGTLYLIKNEAGEFE